MGWSPEDDVRLVKGAAHGWTVPSVMIVPTPEADAPRAFRLRDAVGAVAFERIQAAGALALTGGDGMIRDFLRSPVRAVCGTLGLEQLSHATAAELAAAPQLERVRRLVVLAPEVCLETLLASSHLTRLEAITVVDATALALRALRLLPKHVSVLRVDNAAHAILARELHTDALAELLGTLTARLARLELHGLGVPLDIVAGTPVLDGITELVVDGCELRGAELLGALAELRVVSARDSSFDDGALEALTRCTRLIALDATGSQVTPTGAEAFARAGLPQLQRLTIDHVSTVPRSRRPAAAPDTQLRALVLSRSGPDDAHETATERGWWPRLPLPAGREFVYRTAYFCERCYGAATLASGVACPRHVPTYLPAPYLGTLPPATRDIVTIARTVERFEAAERHVLELARLVGPRGDVREIRTIEWQLRDARWEVFEPPPYPPHPFELVTGALGVPLASARWAERGLRAARAAGDGLLERILEHAVAIDELGYRLADWSGHVARIVMDRELAPAQT